MSEWISVKDRLPEDYSKVLIILIYREGEKIAYVYGLAQYHSHNGWYNGNSSGAVLDNLVKYWMPLPSPPEDIQHENK